MKGSPLTPALYQYIVERFAQEERALLRKMARRAEAAGLRPIMISEDQARFLGLLLRAVGARRALDVGTLFGYSAAIMAQAMGPRGRVVSLDMDERAARVATENLRELGLGDRVEIRLGRALDSLKRLRGRSFDFALIDADKAPYVEYYEEGLRLVRRGGWIAADNTLAWGRVAEPPAAVRSEPDVGAIQRFNDHVSRDRRVEACLLPIGDGLLLAHVKN